MSVGCIHCQNSLTMSESVLKALGYGWTVGVCFVHRMSEKVFERADADADSGFAHEKMTEAESISDVTMKSPEATVEIATTRIPASRTEPDLTRHASEATSTGSLHFDSLDETGARGGSRGRSRATEPLKLNIKDNRIRYNAKTTDIRWNPPGNGNLDNRFYHNDKMEKSQNDLTGGKWNNGNLDYGQKSHAYGSNSSESDIFPSRGLVSSHPNDAGPAFMSRPSHLYKSSSSSQLPCVRSNLSQTNRHWRYPNSSGPRPVSLVTMQQTLIPLPINSQGPYYTNSPPYVRPCCGCNCEGSSKRNVSMFVREVPAACNSFLVPIFMNQGKTESVISLTDDPETREGLSWRRLHMSRAKLKATATTSELLSGFAMVAMVELQINKPTAVPEWLFVMFAVCTTVLVSVHIFALMISTYLLPNIDAVSKLHVSSLVTESPHDRMKGFIELAWAFSTILGLFLFLVEIAILCWVKFWDYSFTAAMSATMIVIPVLIVFVAFAMHFYHSLVVIKCKTSVSNIQELENMKKQLDNASPAS